VTDSCCFSLPMQ